MIKSMWLRYTEDSIRAEVKINGLVSQRALLLSGNTSEVLKNIPIDVRRGNITKQQKQYV